MSQHKHTVMKPQEVVDETECDACGRREKGYDPDGWLHFSSHHSDWGNDSHESWERFDVCSFGCYLNVVGRLFNEYGAEESAHRPFAPTLEIDDKDWWFIKAMLADVVRTRVTVKGGHHDGQIVDWMGQEANLPLPAPNLGYDRADVLPMPPWRTYETYVARQDVHGRWWYVVKEL